MTANRGFKDRVRTRMLVTGESYAAARAALTAERARLRLSSSPSDTIADGASLVANDAQHEATSAPPPPLERPDARDAIVLAVHRRSARVRVVGESAAITLRGDGLHDMLPGQIASIAITKRWRYRSHEHASGAVGEKRIDVAALGLQPLALEDHGVDDLRSSSEPFRAPDPYAPMWRTLTKPARRAFEFDRIAWEGPRTGDDDDGPAADLPVCDAADLIEAGDDAGATTLLMNVLARDLRCLDAHAHLGNIEFRRDPRWGLERARRHYEIGVRIGELSLGPDFRDMLPWGFVYNRPFLRCLKGYGLTLWRLGRFGDAITVFERTLSLNPNDNQGVRFLLADVRTRRSWDDFAREEAARERRRGLPRGTTLH